VKPLAATSFFLAALSLPAWAAAQPAGSAQSHYTIASQLYGTGRFAEAAGEFELAYQASHRTELLFNIARAWEDARNDERALDAYERFQRAGAPGVDGAQVTLRVQNLRARIAARQAPPPRPPPPPPPPTPPPPTRSYTGPIVVLAAGGAMLLGAVPLWLTALGDFNDLALRCPERQCPSPADLTLRDGAATRALVGDVLGGLGAAAAVAGTAWLIVTLTSTPAPTPSTPRASVWCGPTGCDVSVGGTF
jgi:hypothetical protein